MISKKKDHGTSRNVDVNKIMEKMKQQTVEIIEHPKNWLFDELI